jgi:pimeloyl-ACP methyl ester carboxylesterase
MWVTIPVLAILLGAAVQALCARADRRRFAAPGRLVDGLHVCESGTGGPPVVFEAGLAATSVNWRLVQQALVPRARTVSYDRAGLGWSAPATAVPSLRRMTDDLHRLILALDLPRPLVLVGHSFGTWIVRVYASRFPEDVSALVLVDPVSRDEISPRRLGRAALLSDIAAVLALFGLARLGLWGLLRRGGGNPGPVLGMNASMRRMAQEVAKLPADAVPMLRARWSEPRFFRELSAAIRALPACAREAMHLPDQLPIVVLAGSHRTSEYLQALDLPAAKLVIVPGSGHWIHLDAPELVARTVIELHEQNPARVSGPPVSPSTRL